MPLSAGAIVEGELQCAYHGWRFDPSGRCDLAPGLGWRRRIAKRAGLRPAHGVTEEYGLVWLAAQEPLSPLPQFPEWADAAMSRARPRTVRTAASAGQLVPRAAAHARLELPHATIGILLACQPEDARSTRVFLLVSRADSRARSHGGAARLREPVRAEDQALEADLATLDRHPPPPLPLDLGAEDDTAAGQLSAAWRRIMARAVPRLP